MRNSGWSGDRRPRNRLMLITVPLLVTMAVGLVVGIRLVSEKNATLRLSNTGQGTANSTPASPASSPPAASPSPTPSPAATATPTPTPTATDMSCVRISLPAPSAWPPAAGCAAAGTPGRGAGMARAALSAAVLTVRRGQSGTVATKGV
jgi:hypothetical protein